MKKIKYNKIFDDSEESLNEKLKYIANVTYGNWNGPLFYPLSRSLRRNDATQSSSSTSSYSEDEEEEKSNSSSSAFQSYTGPRTALSTNNKSSYSPKPPSPRHQVPRYESHHQNNGYINGMSPHVSLSKRLWLFHHQHLKQHYKQKQHYKEEKEQHVGMTESLNTASSKQAQRWRNGQCVMNNFSMSSDASNGIDSCSGSFRETPSSSSTSSSSSSSSTSRLRSVNTTTTSVALGVTPLSVSHNGPSLMSTSALSPSSTISPSTTKRLFIDEDTPKIHNIINDKGNQQPQQQHSPMKMTKQQNVVFPSVEQSLFDLNESIKSEVALSPEFRLRDYRSPLRYDKASPSPQQQPPPPPPPPPSSTTISSPSMMLNYDLEESLLDVTNDWSKNTEARTRLQQAQAARELNSEKEFRSLEAASTEACRIAEEKAMAEAKALEEKIRKENEDKKKAADEAEAKRKEEEEKKKADEEAKINNEISSPPPPPPDRTITPITPLEEVNEDVTGAVVAPAESTTPPPPRTPPTDSFLSQWRLLKAEAEGCQSSWIKSINKRAKYINLVSSNNIVNNAQSLTASLPSSLQPKYFDFWLVSTIVKKVSTLTNHEADDFLKFGGLLCLCIQMRPTIRPLAIGCIAHMFSSSENDDGGSLLAPSPMFPTRKLPPLHDQGYIELCSLQMCLMEPLSGVILAALTNDFQQQNWLVYKDGDVNILVWLNKLTDLSIQSITGNQLNNNQMMMLGDYVLEPCLRVCGPILWRIYGDAFESVLVKIRKQILRPLDDILTNQRRKDMKPQIKSRVDVFLQLMTASNYPLLSPPPRGVGQIPLFLDFQEEVSGSQKEERSKKRSWLYNWANQGLHFNIRNFPGDIGPEP